MLVLGHMSGMLSGRTTSGMNINIVKIIFLCSLLQGRAGWIAVQFNRLRLLYSRHIDDFDPGQGVAMAYLASSELLEHVMTHARLWM